MEIIDRKGTENQITNHLSRLENPKVDHIQSEVNASFPDEKLLKIEELPWYVDIVNFLVCKQFPENYTSHQKKRLIHECKFYYWDDPNLYKRGPDQILRLYVPKTAFHRILFQCHESPYGGHFGGQRTIEKVLQSISYVANDVATVSKFLQKNNFTRFGTPHVIISDEGTDFVNRIVSKLLIKYNVHHKIATAYHPQTNGQAKGFQQRNQVNLREDGEPIAEGLDHETG
ncbi:uncharacterized protein LOC120089044 [Benincasa hispida]|uniref:uncharacterized protein LOC120089044 n=1 Tax=Benincasa hispida TaxID=102211 RepID=UPI0019005A41|nr:uncharacterized protein LOC120089044 [Benincasa hispida]